MSDTGWIRCADRMPEVDVRVMVLFVDSPGLTQWRDIARWDGDCWDNDNWSSRLHADAVTHWMLLPEPPKEER